MNTTTCPTCGKDRQYEYCPECRQYLGNSDKRGDQLNGTFASCAATTPLNPFRYLWFSSGRRRSLVIWLILVVASAAALTMKLWNLAAILLALAVPFTVILWRICRQMAEYFQKALLTAGIVVSQKPLEFIALANMSTEKDVTLLAVKRVALKRLPGYPKKVGTEFPCVSVFWPGSDYRHWGDFHSYPLSVGTGNVDLITARRAKLGEEDFEILRQAIAQGNYPKQAGKITWLVNNTEPKLTPSAETVGRDSVEP